MIPFVPEGDSSDLQVSTDSELLRWRQGGVAKPIAVAKKLDESRNESSEWLYSVDSNLRKWRNKTKKKEESAN